MSDNAIVNELYDSIRHNGLLETIKIFFGVGTEIQLGFSQKTCEMNIEALNNLSVRSYNGLKRSNIHTVGQIITAINEESLIKIRNLGLKSIAEIKALIFTFGYEQLSDRRKKEFLLNLVQLNMKNN